MRNATKVVHGHEQIRVTVQSIFGHVSSSTSAMEVFKCHQTQK